MKEKKAGGGANAFALKLGCAQHLNVGFTVFISKHKYTLGADKVLAQHRPCAKRGASWEKTSAWCLPLTRVKWRLT